MRGGGRGGGGNRGFVDSLIREMSWVMNGIGMAGRVLTDEVDAGDGKAVDWVERDKEMEAQVEAGLKDGEEGHEG